METNATPKRFTTQTFDKFNNRTDTEWVDPFKGNYDEKKTPWMWPFYHIPSHLVLYSKLRQVKTPDRTSIVIDYDIKAKDWFFARNGKMIINLDGVENIELEPHESNTEVGVGYDKTDIQEVGFWSITQDELFRVCKAKNIGVRISGGSSYVDLKDREVLKFQFMCRSFLSEVYNDNTFDEFINSIASPSIIANSARSSGSAGCFIATAAMGDYDHPTVVELRAFRDNWLLKRKWGISFTNWYYQHGPKAASVIAKSTVLQRLTFILLVKPLQIITKTLK
jgi:hypothetical protein